jgi:hypothetical protein
MVVITAANQWPAAVALHGWTTSIGMQLDQCFNAMQAVFFYQRRGTNQPTEKLLFFSPSLLFRVVLL